ncbi:MAG: hypothetical protein AAGA16_11725 [Cyanobacteria bacterium P01_E01_bin.35]
MMNIKIKNLAVPAFIALSLAVTACAGNQTIENPDAVDGAVQDGIEGVEQGAEDAGDAVQEGLENLQNGAEDAGDAVQDGAKNLQKDATGAAQEGLDNVKQGVDDAGNAIKDLGDKIPGTQSE